MNKSKVMLNRHVKQPRRWNTHTHTQKVGECYYLGQSASADPNHEKEITVDSGAFGQHSEVNRTAAAAAGFRCSVRDTHRFPFGADRSRDAQDNPYMERGKHEEQLCHSKQRYTTSSLSGLPVSAGTLKNFTGPNSIKRRVSACKRMYSWLGLSLVGAENGRNRMGRFPHLQTTTCRLHAMPTPPRRFKTTPVALDNSAPVQYTFIYFISEYCRPMWWPKQGWVHPT